MGILVNTSDFQNLDLYAKYFIPFTETKGSEEKLEGYISQYEKRYLVELLGVELSKLFISDLTNQVPQTQIYLNIYNPIQKDLDVVNYSYSNWCGCSSGILDTRGMKFMIMGFIYFEYMRDQKFHKDLTGVNVAKASNSRETSFNEWGLFQFYNESISDYQQIQYYIKLNESDYPLFNGQNKGIMSPF